MKIFEVGYFTGYSFSVNMISANTGAHEFEAVTETAARHAARYGYTVEYIREIDIEKAEENARRGMPLGMIDDEAEKKYDPSFIAEAEAAAAEENDSAEMMEAEHVKTTAAGTTAREIITCRWYQYIDFDGVHTVEMMFHNNLTGAECWKIYTGRTRKEAATKAKREETRVFNRAARVYG